VKHRRERKGGIRRGMVGSPRGERGKGRLERTKEWRGGGGEEERRGEKEGKLEQEGKEGRGVVRFRSSGGA